MSDIEHVLKRPARYVGSVKEIERQMFVFDSQSQKIVKQNVNYIPSLIKLVREPIDNSIDENIRTNGLFADKIDISIKDGVLTVRDNGRGIPVTLVEDNVYMPEYAWCELKSGSNFDDENDNTTIGQNGEGVSLTNIFCKEFIGETSDGKNKYKIICRNNLSEKEFTVTPSKEKFTKITAKFDYSIFDGVDTFDELHQNIIYTDIINLAMSYPNITFSFNGKQVKPRNFSDYMKFYDDTNNFHVVETRGLKIGVYPTDEFSFVNFINGLNVFNGGNPLNWAVTNIVANLRERIQASYKDIQPSDVKNKLGFVVFFYDMVNPRFDDQAKTICNNTISDFQPQVDTPNWKGFSDFIYKNRKTIVDPIVEVYKVREEIRKRKELASISRPASKKIVVDKYLEPIKERKYLVLTEGDSATGGLSAALGRDEFGYLPMMGKPKNVLELKEFKSIKENKSIQKIVSVLGMNLVKDKQFNLNFDNIVIATDSDVDGYHIFALTYTFFYRFGRNLIEEGKLFRLVTPLVVIKRKGKIEKLLYSLTEYHEYVNNHDMKGVTYQYYKGLGTWDPTEGELEEVIKYEGGIENMLQQIQYDSEAETNLYKWMSKLPVNGEKRKAAIKAREFDINNI